VILCGNAEGPTGNHSSEGGKRGGLSAAVWPSRRGKNERVPTEITVRGTPAELLERRGVRTEKVQKRRLANCMNRCESRENREKRWSVKKREQSALHG